MTPLVITATLDPLAGDISVPGRRLDLDALLAWAVSQRDAIVPALDPEMVRSIEIPLAKEPAGRFHLSTTVVFEPERFRAHTIKRQFPVGLATVMSGMRSVRIDAGPQKSYLIPLEVVTPRDGILRWWGVGDRGEVLALLRTISHLGKKRAVGFGRVARWSVEPCAPWGDGFPVVSPAGAPMRNLPLDWPGLVDPPVRYGRLTYPYWLRRDETEVACPC